MFTGIVRELGLVQGIKRTGDIIRLHVRSSAIYKDVKIGDSVAVNGVCLTVISKNAGTLSFDIMSQTVCNTTLAGLKSNDKVNMEGALKADGRLDGHFVLGHVDCVGMVESIIRKSDDIMMRISFQDSFNGLVVDKGSIAVDGVSLTISRSSMNALEVHLIPHTLKFTTLGLRHEGNNVNLEFDVLGKYAAKQRSAAGPSRISEEFLRSRGF